MNIYLFSLKQNDRIMSNENLSDTVFVIDNTLSSAPRLIKTYYSAPVSWYVAFSHLP